MFQGIVYAKQIILGYCLCEKNCFYIGWKIEMFSYISKPKFHHFAELSDLTAEELQSLKEQMGLKA